MAGPVVRVGAASHAGRRRADNQDAALHGRRTFVVADGMGGHEAGAAASAVAVDVLATLDALPEPPGADAVQAALREAHRRVAALPAHTDRPPGTTVSGVVLVTSSGEGDAPAAPAWLVLNLGDSRTYRLADGVLTQLTHDHTVVAELVHAGVLRPEDARFDARRHIITRALGAGESAGARGGDVELVPAHAGDRVLVCSDGLTDEVDDPHLERVLLAHADPQETADALVAAALDAGGRDNVTVLVVDLLPR